MARFNFKIIALAAFGLCLSACSIMPKIWPHTPPPPPPPPKPVRSIAILSVAEPQSELILNVGSALGPSSNTTLSQPRIDNSTTYTQLLAEHKALFAPDLVKTLSDALKASGYRVTYLADQKSFVSADGKSEDLSQIHTDADAVLVIRFTGAGYVSSPVERSYQPWVTLSARLVRYSTKDELYFETFSGGYQMIAESTVALPSSSRYRYLYFHDLTAAIDESIQGLKDTTNDIASTLAGDLFQGAPAMPEPVPVTPAAGDKTAAPQANSATPDDAAKAPASAETKDTPAAAPAEPAGTH